MKLRGWSINSSSCPSIITFDPPVDEVNVCILCFHFVAANQCILLHYFVFSPPRILHKFHSYPKRVNRLWLVDGVQFICLVRLAVSLSSYKVVWCASSGTHCFTHPNKPYVVASVGIPPTTELLQFTSHLIVTTTTIRANPSVCFFESLT